MFKSGYLRAVAKDKSTYPLILANIGGLGLVFYFGGRKLFEHPDIAVNRDERVFGYTSTNQLDNSAQFRSHTAIFASALAPLSEMLKSITAPKIDKDPLWDIRRFNTKVPPALEHTSAFNDGLFVNVPAVAAPTEKVHYSDAAKIEKLKKDVVEA